MKLKPRRVAILTVPLAAIIAMTFIAAKLFSQTPAPVPPVVQSQPAQQQTAEALPVVLTFTKPLDVGHVIAADDVVWRAWGGETTGLVTAQSGGAAGDQRQTSLLGQVIGRALTVPALAGIPVTMAQAEAPPPPPVPPKPTMKVGNHLLNEDAEVAKLMIREENVVGVGLNKWASYADLRDHVTVIGIDVPSGKAVIEVDDELRALILAQPSGAVIAVPMGWQPHSQSRVWVDGRFYFAEAVVDSAAVGALPPLPAPAPAKPAAAPAPPSPPLAKTGPIGKLTDVDELLPKAPAKPVVPPTLTPPVLPGTPAAAPQK